MDRVEVVSLAADRGVHVLIAKPLAETWQQCIQMVEAAERAGIILAVDQILASLPHSTGAARSSKRVHSETCFRGASIIIQRWASTHERLSSRP